MKLRLYADELGDGGTLKDGTYGVLVEIEDGKVKDAASYSHVSRLIGELVERGEHCLKLPPGTGDQGTE